MRRIGRWALLAVLGLPCSAMAEGKPFLLNLDGRYYTASQAIQIYPDILAVVVPETSASNCRRPNGEAVTPGGQVLYYGPQVTQLFIYPPSSWSQSPAVITRLATVDGDVVCDGEIAEPVVATSAYVFGNGFR